MKVLFAVLLLGASVASAQPSVADMDTRVQILLDRAHFSVGEIDGIIGPNVRRALKAFQQDRGLTASGQVNGETLNALGIDNEVLTTYTLTAEDVNQPLQEKIPVTLLDQSKLDKLSYTSLEEALSEKFHVSPKILKKFNPGIAFKEGAVLTIPIVGEKQTTKAAKIVVTQSESSVHVYDAAGKLIAFYPTTLGSPSDPPPFGEMTVLAPVKNPTYHYDPVRYKSKGTTVKVTLKAGPNNPVGLVWIDLSRDHYGIHGTPEPSKISKNASHGCIRLTNWDALELFEIVEKGVAVTIKK